MDARDHSFPHLAIHENNQSHLAEMGYLFRNTHTLLVLSGGLRHPERKRGICCLRKRFDTCKSGSLAFASG